MPNSNRPLSPFMIGPHYKPQLTSMLSILHRATGVALAAGLALLTWFLFAVLSGEHAFSIFRDFKESFIGQVMLLGWLFSFVYHFFNGIRHLAWDMVLGLSLKVAYATGYLVVILSVITTAAIWTGVK
jgi:succinate dehydrogenase / fumarate reductase cytochrome b subunit